MSKPPVDDEKPKDDDKEVESTDLNEIHDKVVADLLEDNGDNEEDEDDSDKDGDADTKEVKDGDDDSDGEGDADAGDDKPGDDKPDEDQNPTPKEEPAPKAPEPAAELDTDTKKAGKDKIAVKSYEGETLYFNSLEEVPDDFEPASYKEWGKAVQKFTEKEQAERVIAQDEAVRKQKEENDARVKEIKDGWQKDIDQLVADKLMPEDKKERDEISKEVFALMDAELLKGRILDFAPAFEIYQYRNGSKERDEKIKKQNDEKKKRGSRVQGSGTGGGQGSNKQSTAGRTIEAPPSGLSLDDIHSHTLGSL